MLEDLKKSEEDFLDVPSYGETLAEAILFDSEPDNSQQVNAVCASSLDL